MVGSIDIKAIIKEKQKELKEFHEMKRRSFFESIYDYLPGSKYIKPKNDKA